MSTSLLTQNLGKRFRYGQMDRLLYLADGLHQSKMYDGSNLVNWGIKAPSTASTVAASSTGANVLDACELLWTAASSVVTDCETAWALPGAVTNALATTSSDAKAGSNSALFLLGTSVEPLSSKTVFMLHGDGTDGTFVYTDSSSYGHSFARIDTSKATPTVATAQSVFGGASLYSNGSLSGNGISCTGGAELTLDGDFTIDFRFRRETGQSQRLFLLGSGATSDYMQLMMDIPANKVTFYRGAGVVFDLSYTFTISTWYHVCIQRRGSTCRLFVNGVSIGTGTQASSFNSAANSFTLFTTGVQQTYVDEFRLDKGIARFADAGFVVPGSAYGNFSTLSNDPTGVTGQIGYKTLSPTQDLSGYYGLEFWIKSAKATVTSDLALAICDGSGGASEIERVSIPSLSADTWTKITYAFVNPSVMTTVESLALYLNRDLGTNAIYIDDVRAIRCKVTLDGTDRQEGAASIKIEIPGNVPDNTLVAYRDLGTTVDMSGDTVVLMNVKTNKATGYQQLQYLLDDTAGCVSPVESIYLTENLAADSWTSLTLAMANPAACSAIVSHGLTVKTRTVAPITIWIDNVKRATTAAGNLTGRYFVWVSFYNSKYDKESDLSPISSVVDCNAQAINVGSIPVSTDPQVDMRRIYRSAAGSSLPYLDTTIADNTTAAIVLNRSDASLSSRAKHPSGAAGSGKFEMPPSAPYLIQFKNRFVVAGSLPYSRGTVDVVNGSATFTFNLAQLDDSFVGRTLRVVGDDLNYTIESVNAAAKTCVARPIDDPIAGTYRGTTANKKTFEIIGMENSFATSFVDDNATPRPHGFPVDYYQDVLEGRANDRITGLGLIGDAILILKAYSSHIAEGTFPPYTVTRISDVIGCVSHDTVIQDERSYGLWLAGEQGLAYSEGFNVQIVSNPITEIFSGEDTELGLNTSNYQNAHAVYDIKEKLYYLFVASADSEKNNVCIILDKSGSDPEKWVWYYFTGIEAACSTIMYDENGVGTVYIGDYDGFMYQLNIGYYDGVALGTLRGTPTSATGNVLTDGGASFYTNGSGLKGISLIVVNVTTGAVYSHKILSNTSTAITIEDSFAETLGANHRYYVGGYELEWSSKVQELARVTDKKLLVDAVVNNYQLDQSQITKMSILKNLSGTSIASQLLDFSTGEEQVMLIRERVSQAQWKLEGFVHGQAIKINSLGLRFRPRGTR